jgi:hypothetical protein
MVRNFGGGGRGGTWRMGGVDVWWRIGGVEVAAASVVTLVPE